ncbi:MAG: hypothetical protein GAK28_02820 [Luteibacter sp.]|nr:MAG: hypothetical protein GAK28_02820 [Luteibacter sp.]
MICPRRWDSPDGHARLVAVRCWDVKQIVGQRCEGYGWRCLVRSFLVSGMGEDCPRTGDGRLADGVGFCCLVGVLRRGCSPAASLAALGRGWGSRRAAAGARRLRRPSGKAGRCAAHVLWLRPFGLGQVVEVPRLGILPRRGMAVFLTATAARPSSTTYPRLLKSRPGGGPTALRTVRHPCDNRRCDGCSRLRTPVGARVARKHAPTVRVPEK